MKLKLKQLKFFQDNGFIKLNNVVKKSHFESIKNIINPWVNNKIQTWLDEGLITHKYSNLDFWHRFLIAWKDAGKPSFRRNPNRWLINKEMYKLLKNKVFINIAYQLLDTREISVHGIFNTRPQLPAADFAKAPWHQDSQYWSMNYGQKYDDPYKSNVLTFFIPLQNVGTNSGCLSLMSIKDTKKKLFKAVGYDFKKTGYLGLSKKDIKKYKKRPIPMKAGDILVFNHLVPHGTSHQKKQYVRWSLDIRYEATHNATGLGKKFGFIAASKKRQNITKESSWIKKSLK